MLKNKLEIIRNRCGFNEGLCVDSNGSSGGIGLWWKDLEVSLISFSTHHVLVEIKDDRGDGNRWFACGVYGWPERANKFQTSELLKRVRESVRGPLVVFGDFNEILSMNEKEGGAVRRDCEMEVFRECLDVCGLVDLGYRGSAFTWSRGNNPSNIIRERLDRFVACSNWINLFSSYEIRHLPIYKSDHAPICLSTDFIRRDDYGQKLFRFESLWLSKDECRAVVQEAWNEGVGENIDFRIEHCASQLSSWADATFGDLKKRIRHTEKQLIKAQRSVPDAGMIANCKAITDHLDELHRLEESYWHLRSWANELRDGDKNSSYFHHKASSRRRRNSIKADYCIL